MSEQQKQFNDAMQLANSINILCKNEGIDVNTEMLGIQMVLYSMSGSGKGSFKKLMQSLAKDVDSLEQLFDNSLDTKNND